MALEVVKARRLGRRNDRRVLVLVAGDERDVHERAVLLLDGAVEQFGGIEEVIHDLRLLLVALRHGFEAAGAEQVLEDLAADVDRPAVRRVVHGAVVRVRVKAQIDRDLRVDVLADEVLADDDDRKASRADVLLDAAVDQAVVGHVAGLRKEHRALVGDEDLALGVRKDRVGRAVDRFVLADVDIVRVVVDRQIGAVRNVAVVLIFAGRDDVDLAVLLGFRRGLLGPVAGNDVVEHAVLAEVQRDHGELKRCAALNEQDLVVVRNAHQRAEIRLRLVNDLLEHLAAVGHFHDAHAAAVIVQHLVPDLFQHLNGHRGGTCGEIVNAIVLHLHTPFFILAKRHIFTISL